MLDRMRPLIRKTSCIVQTHLDNMKQILIMNFWLTYLDTLRPLIRNNSVLIQCVEDWMQQILRTLFAGSNYFASNSLIVNVLLSAQLEPYGVWFLNQRSMSFRNIAKTHHLGFRRFLWKLVTCPREDIFLESSAAQTMVQNGIDATL